MPIFDGPNLVIILDPSGEGSVPGDGISTVSAKVDLYSDWKEWVKESDNAKYPMAFRTIGGDELTPGIDAGAYFFIQNQIGWRIRPAEEDGNILMTGNLVPEDSALPILVPTIGEYTVLVAGLQPITQSVEGLLTDIEFASFQNGVTIDVVNGSSGTEFPTGTAREPVDNLADAYTILTDRGFGTYYVRGNLIVDSGTHPYLFQGQSIATSSITINPAALVHDARFENATISGTLDGDAAIQNCSIGILNFFNGVIKNCVLEETISLGGGIEALILDCWSGVPGAATPTIDMGGSGQSMALRGYNGGIELINKSGPESVSIDLASGQIVIDNTVTNGDIVLRGTGKWTNRETYTGGANVINELADGLLIQQLDHTVFDGVITIDPINGVSGTSFPTGTSKQPVSNITDALAISAVQGIDDLFFVNSYTFDASDDVSGKTCEGKISTIVLTSVSGTDTTGTSFKNCTVTGTVKSTLNYEGCNIVNITDESPAGVGSMLVRNCAFSGYISLSSLIAGEVIMVDCYSGNHAFDGSTEYIYPRLIMNGADLDFHVREYSGFLILEGITAADAHFDIDMLSGSITIDSSCTDGDVIIRGICNLIDNSSGTRVDTTGVIFANELQLSSFNSYVSLDVSGGESGTKFPVGTHSNPVNNLSDAKTILSDRGLDTIELTGTLVVLPGDDISDIKFFGTNSLTSVVALISGCTTDNTVFRSMIITGTCNGALFCERVGVQNLLNVGSDTSPIVFDECIFLEGTFGFRSGLSTPQNIQITNGTGGVSSGSGSVFDFNGTTSRVAIRNYVGNMNVQNFTGGQTGTFEFFSGETEFDSSCTSGTANVRGICKLTDNSSGSFVVDATGLIDPPDIEQIKRKTATLPVVIPLS